MTCKYSKCYFLTSISIPDGVTSLGYDVFYYCSGLTSITIPPNMTSIGRSTFQYCTGLTTVTIPDGVTSLGENAFRSCTGLTSVTLPGSVSSIGDNAFAYCSELTNMYCYAEQVPETGDRVFYSSNSANATLHVPAGCIDTYGRAEQWKDFKAIVALTDSDPNPSGIITPAATKQPAIAEYFDLQGRLLSGKPDKGLFIENGKKVIKH